ncbi:MAG: hypothetical protein FWC77_02820 [Defluviitaleaceae bacterium]|nr:hypothetical protein [Defluviitaleaceae bacterium]
MRRKSKNGRTVKKLTVAAAIAVLSLGTVSAYADSGFDYIRVGGQELRIDDLANNDSFRRSVIEAFNAVEPILVRDNDGSWVEISQSANYNEGFAALVNENHDLFPYL